MFALNAKDLEIGIPFIMHPNGLVEELNIDVPSVYPYNKEEVFVEETFGLWKVISSNPTEEVTEEFLSILRNHRSGVFAVVSVGSYCEENECSSCEDDDCDVKLVIIKKK